jgi:hypothetical protein
MKTLFSAACNNQFKSLNRFQKFFKKRMQMTEEGNNRGNVGNGGRYSYVLDTNMHDENYHVTIITMCLSMWLVLCPEFRSVAIILWNVAAKCWHIFTRLHGVTPYKKSNKPMKALV